MNQGLTEPEYQKSDQKVSFISKIQRFNRRKDENLQILNLKRFINEEKLLVIVNCQS